MKMKWSKQGSLIPGHQSKESPPRPPPGSRKGHDSSFSESTRLGLSSLSRPRPPVTPPSLHASKASLLPDAVDLVVEDTDARAEKMTKERRKEEPSVHGQAGEELRRVYSRGYEARDGEGEEANVEVTEEMGLAGDDEGTDDMDEPPEELDVKVVKPSAEEDDCSENHKRWK